MPNKDIRELTKKNKRLIVRPDRVLTKIKDDLALSESVLSTSLNVGEQGSLLGIESHTSLGSLSIDVTSTGEVCFLRLGNDYVHHELAYDKEDKIKTLLEYEKLLTLVLAKNYYEVVHSVHGKLLKKDLVVYRSNESDVVLRLSTKQTLASRLKMLLPHDQKRVDADT